MPPFENEPPTDFSRRENREAFQRSLHNVRSKLGQTTPLMIGGKEIRTARTMARYHPSHPHELVSRISLSDSSHCEAALTQAEAAFASWRKTPVAARAKLLRQAAHLMRKRRFELAAWEVVETGKPWVEADADLSEAIDYLDFYSDQMLRLGTEASVGQVPGEENRYRRDPLGPGVVISPWNFPLAIPMGMTAAALVTGNCVLLKPAEQSSVVAYHLVKLLLEAGIPPGVIQYVSGIGEETGEFLVRSPRIHWIAFTGSKAVGLRILQMASEVSPGQNWVKRVIAEMGGKNAIVIDQDADLDEAVLGVLASAFGYSGQKCSACSRVIVLQTILQRFLDRLIDATRSLPIGPAENPGTVIGPLIDKEALTKVQKYIEVGKKEGKLVFQGHLPDGLEGYFLPPVIFAEVDPKATIAQEEIFGPVLVIHSAHSFEEGLGIANQVPYALTGGVYSRSPKHIEQAKEAFHVGNLYINRKITGAIVGRQPFGGLRLSGVGQKAGGPDYLFQFLQARTISENTLRHGFDMGTSLKGTA